MRPRGSFTGPLFIIALGCIFLLHAISPQFALIDWLGQFWPYLLIIWGSVALIEVVIRAIRPGPVPYNGVSGGAWVVVVLICILGATFAEIRRPDSMWQNTDWGRGFDNAFGEEHQYSVNTTQKTVGAAPHIVIESFRGDAKIVGVSGSQMSVAGHKTVRALKAGIADESDSQTPVEVLVEGKNVIIRCNQSKALHRTFVTTDLDLQVPKNASIELDNSSGDLEVSSVDGKVALRSGNSGVRLQDMGGDVSIEGRRSDLIRCTNVKGAVDLRGHGSDVELSRISGEVSISGDYTGTLSLRGLEKPAHVKNNRTDLQIASVPGEIRLDRGSLNVQDATGPLRLNTHSTDVSLENVSNVVEISVDRGDIDLKPGRLPLGKIAAHTHAGNIDFAMPADATFALNASTDSGQVENDFGDALKEQTSGRGARLEGAIGGGANVELTTNRGNITVRKDGAAAQTTVAALR
jgi:DUF4097 and DUF4098 domain-containing protein YvlB